MECPSIYEMLPNPEFKWKKQPEILVWRGQSTDGEAAELESFDTKESVFLFEEALRNNEVLQIYLKCSDVHIAITLLLHKM